MRLAALFLLAVLACGLSAQVTFETRSDRVAVQINGKAFTNLYYGKDVNKPFLHPLVTASGKVVTRGLPSDPIPGEWNDHPHQRGVWVGSELLSGTDFWENDPSYKRAHMGKIEFKDITAAAGGVDHGTLSIVADWISENGTTVLTERRSMVFYAAPANCRVFDVEIEFEGKQKVVFEDHKDDVIGVRLGLPFDNHYGGTVVNAQGIEDSKIAGSRSEWVDWSGTVDGERVGLAIFDHPSNLNYPAHWNMKGYGILFANPFGRHAFDPSQPVLSYTLEPGKKLHLRYRFVVHSAGVDLREMYMEFAKSNFKAAE